MSQCESTDYFERFLSPKDRAIATNELAKTGEPALEILEALFDGSAKNRFGVSYKDIGALGCGFVTAKMLGELAKPLEVFIRDGIESDHVYAIEAAGTLINISENTAIELARAAMRNPFGEAPYSLIKCGEHKNPKVLSIIGGDSKTVSAIEKAENHLNNEMLLQKYKHITNQ